MLSPTTSAAASPRTPRSTPRRRQGSENTTPGSNRAVAPWSLSKVDRFSGHNSLYKPATPSAQQASGAKETTPRKTPSKQMPAADERYATVAERVINAPTSSVTPTAAYLSVTDRFTVAGGVYTQEPTPGVGSYDTSKLEARVTGAVKLQKAIRRRQSRGIFAGIESRAREVPAVGSYTPLPESIEAAPKGHDLSREAARFGKTNSIYAHESTPAAGVYDPEQPRGSVAGSKSAFRGQADRFEGLHSIYSATETPGVGDYDVCGASGVAASSKATKPSPAYINQTDRFGGLHSLYHTSAAPGVGSYHSADAEGSAASSAQNATYSSKTDRFHAKDGVYAAVAAGTPGVGSYEVASRDKVLGAVKLQKAIRRRQSRGIFAGIEARAREVPAAGFYTPSVGSIAEAPSGRGAFTKGSMRFDGVYGSIYAREQTPAAGEYEPPKPQPAGSTMPSAIARSNTSRFAGPSSIYAAVAQAAKGTPSKGTPSKGTPSKGTPSKGTPSQAVAAPKHAAPAPWVPDFGPRSGDPPPVLSVGPSLDSMFPVSPSTVVDGDGRSSVGLYSVGGTALGIYDDPRFSSGGTALGAYAPPVELAPAQTEVRVALS